MTELCNAILIEPDISRTVCQEHSSPDEDPRRKSQCANQASDHARYTISITAMFNLITVSTGLMIAPVLGAGGQHELGSKVRHAGGKWNHTKPFGNYDMDRPVALELQDRIEESIIDASGQR